MAETHRDAEEVVEYVELKVTTNRYRVHIKSKRNLHELVGVDVDKRGGLVEWLETTARRLRAQAAEKAKGGANV